MKTKTPKQNSKGRKIRKPKKFISTDDSTDDNNLKIKNLKRTIILSTMETFLNSDVKKKRKIDEKTESYLANKSSNKSNGVTDKKPLPIHWPVASSNLIC